MDYTALDLLGMFSPGDPDTVRFTLMVSEDEIVEDPEMLSILLSSNDSAVQNSTGTLNVTIQDNDGV